MNSLRGKYASFLQEVTRRLGKAFLVKTGHNARLGYIHSSVGSLAFAHLGLTSNKTTALTPSQRKTSALFLVNEPSYSESFFK